MPVTKTAKRALRGSKRKQEANSLLRAKLEIAIRKAKKETSKKTVAEAISLVDRAAKKGLFHKNKAARLKSSLAKLRPTKTTSKKSK